MWGLPHRDSAVEETSFNAGYDSVKTPAFFKPDRYDWDDECETGKSEGVAANVVNGLEWDEKEDETCNESFVFGPVFGADGVEECEDIGIRNSPKANINGR